MGDDDAVSIASSVVVVVDAVVVVVRGLVVSTSDISSVKVTGAVLTSRTSSMLLETEIH